MRFLFFAAGLFFLAVTFFLSFPDASQPLRAAELLPFPSQEQQGVRYVPPYLVEFRKKLLPLSCEELGDVRDGLTARIREASTSSDSNYFRGFVDVLDEVAGRRCP